MIAQEVILRGASSKRHSSPMNLPNQSLPTNHIFFLVDIRCLRVHIYRDEHIPQDVFSTTSAGFAAAAASR